MPFVTTGDGTEIFYKDWGSGRPVVFHHGWPLSSDDWDPQLMFFVQRGYRVVAHDRRGHGRSTQTSDGHDMDTYAADAAAVAEHLDLRDAVHVGHSTGGGEVTRYVARHGAGRVAKAVLIGAVPPLMLKTDANPGGLPIEVFDSFREGTASNRAQFFLDVASGPFYGFNRPGAEASEGVIRNWWRQGMMGGVKAHYEGIKAFSETDLRADARDARRRRPGGAHRRLGRAVDHTAAARHARGVSGLPTRHVHDPRRRDQPRPARVHRRLTGRHEVVGVSPDREPAATIAAQRVADVRDRPDGRVALLRSSYRPTPGTRPLHLRYARAALAFMG
jgi:non-heme chloroperoxidase